LINDEKLVKMFKSVKIYTFFLTYAQGKTESA